VRHPASPQSTKPDRDATPAVTDYNLCRVHESLRTYIRCPACGGWIDCRDLGQVFKHQPYKEQMPEKRDCPRKSASGSRFTRLRPLTTLGTPRLRCLAMAIDSEHRSPLVPDVPTLRELGYRGDITQVYFGLVAPAGTPAPIIARLNEESEDLGHHALFLDDHTLASWLRARSPPNFLWSNLAPSRSPRAQARYYSSNFWYAREPAAYCNPLVRA
jgi:hypothetical protein